MAECGGLENRWARKRPVGSNPTLSASYVKQLNEFQYGEMLELG